MAHGSFATGLAVAAFGAGCGSPDDASSPDGGDGNGAEQVFTPGVSSFADYTSWKHFHLDFDAAAPFPLAPEGGAMTDLVHAEGTRDIYINFGQPGAPKCVAKGATEFPVGTIIVKILAQPNQTLPGVFATAKVTANGLATTYNSAGAAGWEWFDLLTAQNGMDAGDDPQILWSGPYAATNQAYGANPDVCNNCHTAMGSANDSIISPVLELEDFACAP